jgi:hypothetical protein
MPRFLRKQTEGDRLAREFRDDEQRRAGRRGHRALQEARRHDRTFDRRLRQVRPDSLGTPAEMAAFWRVWDLMPMRKMTM